VTISPRGFAPPLSSHSLFKLQLARICVPHRTVILVLAFRTAQKVTATTLAASRADGLPRESN
jgi:hypothetical protein